MIVKTPHGDVATFINKISWFTQGSLRALVIKFWF